ncbi:ficolin-2-like [Saccostrea echinata]|uniref:ficolin-2-like n=1 Tax=Saccostrea echinata TaxID=191078 RepID=UPI002A8080D7|nr:ficolin-2-like [Saccostrea echinata]
MGTYQVVINTQFNMNSLIAISFIVLFSPATQAINVSPRYTAQLEFDNKMSDNKLLGEFKAQTLTLCAIMCNNECGLFGFHHIMEKCRIHQKIFTSGLSDGPGWRYYLDGFLPVDCKDLRDNGHTNTGVYEIYFNGTNSDPVRVYCDMETMNGGWTAIQKRINGSLSFEKNWTEYKNGFGSPEQDVWIGNDDIHQLTKGGPSSLYISITLVNGSRLYELYNEFSISSEADKYQLFLAGPATGTLGDRMLNSGNPYTDLSGMSFSTSDRDNDKWSGVNCAADWGGGGGWWYNSCNYAYLNGPWSSADWYDPWNPPVKYARDVKETMMLIKRH